jgi:hypothetical protein
MNATEIVRARGARKEAAQIRSLRTIQAQAVNSGRADKARRAYELRMQIQRSGKCVKPQDIRTLLYGEGG